jgi:hypothetical protein
MGSNVQAFHHAPTIVTESTEGKKGQREAAPEAAVFELVRRSALPHMTSTRCTQVQAAWTPDLDWQMVSRLAALHGVRPVVYANLQECVAEALPEAFQEHIAAYQRTLQLRNTFMVQELGRLHDALDARSIPSLALKGPALAHVAYGGIDRRQYVDLDVLIPANRFDEAERLIESLGYAPFSKVAGLSGFRRRLYLFLSKQWAFKRGKGFFNLDLHTRVMPPGYGGALDFDVFAERMRKVEVNGIHLPVLSSEAMIVLLCYHGLKNQWNALKYVLDVAAVIEAQPVNWQRVEELSVTLNAERAVALGLLLTHEVFGVRRSLSVLRTAQAHWGQTEVMPPLVNVLQGRHQGADLPYPQRVRLQLNAQGSVADKMRYGLYSAARHIWATFLKPPA